MHNNNSSSLSNEQHPNYVRQLMEINADSLKLNPDDTSVDDDLVKKMEGKFKKTARVFTPRQDGWENAPKKAPTEH